jgi:hypothetical protein
MTPGRRDGLTLLQLLPKPCEGRPFVGIPGASRLFGGPLASWIAPPTVWRIRRLQLPHERQCCAEPLVVDDRVCRRPAETLIVVKSDRLAMRLEISARRAEIIECRFRGDKSKMHQSACRVVNKREQRTLLRAVLKPRPVPSRRSVPARQSNRADGVADAARADDGGDRSIDPPRSSSRAMFHARSCSRGPPPASPPPASGQNRISFAHLRQRQITIRLRQTVVARPAASLRDQAGGAAVFQSGPAIERPGAASD